MSQGVGTMDGVSYGDEYEHAGPRRLYQIPASA